MISLKSLSAFTRQGLKLIQSQPGLIEGLVYASANQRTVGRLVYTSHLPSTGLEEPKADTDFGVAVEVWFKKAAKKLLGFGHEPSEFSLAAVKRALTKAVRDAVEDPDFHGFVKPAEFPPTSHRLRAKFASVNTSLTSAAEAQLLARFSWETIQGAVDQISSYAQKHHRSPEDIAFILNGDNFLITEQMALSTTTGIFAAEASQLTLSFLTGMLERDNAKGSAWGATIGSRQFSAYDLGRQVALAAINSIGGVKISGGKYNVVFGPQATTEIIANLLLPHLKLDLVDFGASIFTGKFGHQVASHLLTLSDDATLPAGAGSKRVTCEGYPTGRTLLIDKGKLVGFLSDSKTTNKLLGKPAEAKKLLGVDPHQIRPALRPRNGFRFSSGGGRVATAPIGIHATNLVIESAEKVSPSELLRRIKEGIFIGRLWYTYPVGGYSSGIISGTAIADCFRIRAGKLAEPILPNTLRLEDNLNRLIQNIIGIANNQTPTILWASDEITHAPWLAIKQVNFRAINQ